MVYKGSPSPRPVLHPVEGMVDISQGYSEQDLEHQRNLPYAYLAMRYHACGVQSINQLDQRIFGIRPEDFLDRI